MPSLCRVLFGFLFCFRLCSIGFSEESSERDLKVMSFNIRLGVANDGPNHWDKRKELVAQTIRNYSPDLLGLQEVWPMQEAYLKEKFPGYEYYGRSRLSDPREGEQCAVMFRKDRFELLGKRTFWLSETPGEPESKSWDSSLPRIANWTRLKDQRNLGQKLVLVNIHFDHRGRESRVQAAKLIHRRVAKLGTSARVVLTGDFNAGEGSPPYKALVGDSLLDTFRICKLIRTEEEGTFTAWKGKRDGNRIDWVLCSPNFKVLSAAIDHTEFDGRYPSDHYPVTAILRANPKP